MKAALTNLRDRAAEYLRRGFAYARYYYERYPVRTQAYAGAAIVFLATKLGIVVDQQSLLTALGYALPFILGGEFGHAKAEPVKKNVRKPRKRKLPKA